MTLFICVACTCTCACACHKYMTVICMFVSCTCSVTKERDEIFDNYLEQVYTMSHIHAAHTYTNTNTLSTHTICTLAQTIDITHVQCTYTPVMHTMVTWCYLISRCHVDIHCFPMHTAAIL